MQEVPSQNPIFPMYHILVSFLLSLSRSLLVEAFSQVTWNAILKLNTMSLSHYNTIIKFEDNHFSIQMSKRQFKCRI
jgi:hypothetical protein